jgi:hypothetical protein
MICATAGERVLAAEAAAKTQGNRAFRRCREVFQFIDVTRAHARTRSTSLYASTSLHLRAIEIVSKFRMRRMLYASVCPEVKETTA